MTCTDSIPDGTDCADCTGILPPPVPRLVPRPSRRQPLVTAATRACLCLWRLLPGWLGCPFSLPSPPMAWDRRQEKIIIDRQEARREPARQAGCFIGTRAQGWNARLVRSAASSRRRRSRSGLGRSRGSGFGTRGSPPARSEEQTSELQPLRQLVC